MEAQAKMQGTVGSKCPKINRKKLETVGDDEGNKIKTQKKFKENIWARS